MEMKIKILKTTVAAKQIVHMGQFVDLEMEEAKFLIKLNKAEPVGIDGVSLLNKEEPAQVAPQKRGRKKKETWKT